MLSSVALDRKIACFHSWTCVWSEYQQISYRFAEQDKAVKLWKSINNLFQKMALRELDIGMQINNKYI